MTSINLCSLRCNNFIKTLLWLFCVLTLLAFQSASFAAGRIANVSTRANVGTGNNNVILGTIIVGSGTATLVFRGIGPSLAPYFPGATLANPNLEIKDSNGGTIGANNNWQDNPGQAAAIQAAGLAPTNANESAFWIQLGAGSYSAILSGVGGGTGIGLVEVYDITSQPSSIRLGNVSTRANAGTGNNTEVFGMITQGGNKSLGLRGIGPSLAPYFPGTLANPALSLRNSGGSQLQYNQNWQDSTFQRFLIQAYGLAPSNALESAMVTDNLNGTYTVVMDTSGGSGISSIEAYDLGELLGYGGGNGALVCTSPSGNEFVLGETGPFTVPPGTPVTLRYGIELSQPNCPQCPSSPGCSMFTGSVDAAFRDNNYASTTMPNSGIGPISGQCTLHTKTTGWSIPYGFAAPYRVRLRGYSNASCPLYQGVAINVDYFALNGP